ncbi:MAG: AAA family ATPase, partial [Candidatus Eremiobacterota bacterium]
MNSAIKSQVHICEKIFTKPVCIISGAAGTGKTTVIKSLIKAVEKAHGSGTSFQLLAPTGKAADRIREKSGKSASTIHSFLAKLGWLNDNLTFKRTGGKCEQGFSTYIIDEASMLDLNLMATLFRAINWSSVQRLILVGDPNQLPPIGRGKIFSDIINWIEEHNPECLGHLDINMRQMENRLNNLGTGILDLASIYIQTKLEEKKYEKASLNSEKLLQGVQEGGEIDKDLRAVYWKGAEELEEKLCKIIISDMEKDNKCSFNEKRPFDLWPKNASDYRPEYLQVLTPYRGERFGIENLNVVIQKLFNKNNLERIGHIDGITIFDKVIQYCNRPKSYPVWAYNISNKMNEQIEIYNGELGFVRPHSFDKNPWYKNFYFRRFQVKFTRRDNHLVSYGKELGKTPRGYWLPGEKVGENLELAYIISVHKSQGSEFERTYLIIPKHKKA